MIEVSAKVAGQVVEFPVSQGDELMAGALIAQIDDRAARLTLAELEAQYQSMESACQRLEAQIDMVDRESGSQLSREVAPRRRAGLARRGPTCSSSRANGSARSRVNARSSRSSSGEPATRTSSRRAHQRALAESKRATSWGEPGEPDRYATSCGATSATASAPR
jgi:multidrug resistance efflux pump